VNVMRRCVLAVTLCAACATDVSNLVRVEPGPAPSTVVFTLASRDLVYGLSVLTCRGRDMWTISNEKLGGAPSRITYGVAPAGFVSRTGPRTLEPGCYEIIVSGPSRTRFRIGNDGRLVVGGNGVRVESHRSNARGVGTMRFDSDPI
jgi:hypothetical protein